jgi:uncharacterized membrane protein YgdD (TMEM256/DUF423 family)
MPKLFLIVAGLCGAAGVALSAVAAHSGGDNVGTAANFLLLHAPAFLAVGLFAAGRWLNFAAAVLLLGLLLFAGDLLTRDYFGTRLFPGAAPAGGVLMIAGWIGLAVAGLLRTRP